MLPPTNEDNNDDDLRSIRRLFPAHGPEGPEVGDRLGLGGVATPREANVTLLHADSVASTTSSCPHKKVWKGAQCICQVPLNQVSHVSSVCKQSTVQSLFVRYPQPVLQLIYIKLNLRKKKYMYCNVTLRSYVALCHG